MAIGKLLGAPAQPQRNQQAAPASLEHVCTEAADDLRCGLFSLSSAVANRPGAIVYVPPRVYCCKTATLLHCGQDIDYLCRPPVHQSRRRGCRLSALERRRRQLDRLALPARSPCARHHHLRFARCPPQDAVRAVVRSKSRPRTTACALAAHALHAVHLCGPRCTWRLQ